MCWIRTGMYGLSNCSEKWVGITPASREDKEKEQRALLWNSDYFWETDINVLDQIHVWKVVCAQDSLYFSRHSASIYMSFNLLFIYQVIHEDTVFFSSNFLKSWFFPVIFLTLGLDYSLLPLPLLAEAPRSKKPKCLKVMSCLPL